MGGRCETGLEIDQPAPPWIVREGAPLGGDERGVIAVHARPDDARMLVERESDLGLESKAGALEDDFGDEFAAHNGKTGVV